MKVIDVVSGQGLTYYLALEEEMAGRVTEPTFFTWIVPPTVIYGRHQCQEVEVNETYCAQHGIAVVQRKSGGGCVYADTGNLMLSYIVPKATTTTTSTAYEHFMQMVSEALRKMGYEAVTTAHNDILVGDRKVCGTACYALPHATIVHASMLYDVDMDALVQAITPTEQKLAKHAIASVRQRVCNLREVHDFGSIEAFRKQLETIIQTYGNI